MHELLHTNWTSSSKFYYNKGSSHYLEKEIFFNIYYYLHRKDKAYFIHTIEKNYIEIII